MSSTSEETPVRFRVEHNANGQRSWVRDLATGQLMGASSRDANFGYSPGESAAMVAFLNSRPGQIVLENIEGARLELIKAIVEEGITNIRIIFESGGMTIVRLTAEQVMFLS
jgi:hypothetical protein